MITYRLGNDLDLDQVLELYRASTLGERRPVDDRGILADMIRHANLIVTAWDDRLLVGISRSLTDFSYVAYLADLAVRDTHQKLGIGRGAHCAHARRNGTTLDDRAAGRSGGSRLLPEARIHTARIGVGTARG
jgi:hypothetical protein